METKNLVRTAKAEETTSAREIACENIRNMTSALHAFSVQATEVPNFLLFNFDATISTVVGDLLVGPAPTGKFIGKVQQNKSIQ